MSRSWRVRLTAYGYLSGYLIAMNVLMFVNVFLAGRNVSTLALLPVAAGSLVLTVWYFKNVFDAPGLVFTPLDLAVSAYFFYSVLSFFLYLQPGNPASLEAYLYGLNVQILPMFMYFVAKGVNTHDVDRSIRLVIWLQLACAVVGIALFLLRPEFYSAYLQEKLGLTENWQIYGRLQSYMGSTATGILSAVAITLLPGANLSKFLRYTLWIVFLFTIFLTQQRGAYISGILASAFLLYRSRISLVHLGIALVSMFAALFVALDLIGFSSDLFVWIVENRIVDSLILGNPLGERVDAYRKGIEFLSEFPLGLGLGATTSAADDAGAHFGGQVVDAYYMRVACDLGFVGIVLFVTVLALAAYSAVRKGTADGFALIVVIYAIQSTGTNVLDSYYVSHIFWLLLGYIGMRTISPVPPVGRSRLVRLVLGSAKRESTGELGEMAGAAR